MQVEEVLQELPARREGRRHQLDQRLGVVCRDVLVGERRAERARMRGLADVTGAGNAQRLLFHALAAALQDVGLAAVDESRKSSFEFTVYAGLGHDSLVLRFAASCRLRGRARKSAQARAGL